jgi:hypothetical protein
MRTGTPDVVSGLEAMSKGLTPNATRYVGSGCDGSNSKRELPAGSGVVARSGVLLTAVTPAGTSSVSCQGTLRSGSSTQGKTRRA